ncbi:MAG: tRNA (adenosine(37)-N6)-threonylcarbamoyltransferase complex dimerization subunit type 1 TsaB [Eubacteriales bacterium]|nr:tRNA (adenosine(37)-N6)-threonylcarbamoyltransferase complex dimerization subunit type 1 TsaB [Eubacteriales bacterium]
MKILAIESSGLTASAAFLDGETLKTEFTVNNRLTHSETLLPMIREMLDIAGIPIESADAIAVSAGPGSFTGLRIGAATAKGLALALNRPIVSVSALQAMAYGLSILSDAVICPIMDARRAQVYCAAFRCGAAVLDEGAKDIRDFINELAAIPDAEDAEFVFIGDGVPVHADTISSELPREVIFAGALFNRQRAAGVAELGSIIYKDWLLKHGLSAEEVSKAGADSISCFEGRVMNSDNFVPEYLRQTQAEREMKAGLLEDAGKHSLRKMQDKDTRRKREQ